MRSQPIVEPGLPGLVKAGALAQANALGTVVRNAVFLFAAVVYLAQPFHTHWGNLLAAATFAWGVGRLLTLSLSFRWVVADGVFGAGLCAAEVLLVGPGFGDPSMSFTRAIAEAVVVSVAISMPTRISAPIIGSAILACLFGHWLVDGSLDPTVLYPLVDGFVAAAIRWGFVRAAFAADQLSDAVRVERLRSEVAQARRRFEREQLALLHDTAASTLLMVGDGSAPDRDRLAQQAAHDVVRLEAAAKSARNDAQVDLVAALAEVCAECQCSARLVSSGPVTVTRTILGAVCGATREALNNANRHSKARHVDVSVQGRLVTITDDGVGFAAYRNAGYGIRASIEDRMRRAGGEGTVESVPGVGTQVRLTWPDDEPSDRPESPIDPDRVQRGFGYGIAAGSLVATLELVPRVFTAPVPYLWAQLLLITLTLASSVIAGLATAGVVVRLAEWYAPFAFLLSPIALLLLPEQGLIGGQNWVFGVNGWGVVALLVGAGRPRTALALGSVAATWTIDSVIILARSDSPNSAAYVGYMMVAIGTLQVFAVLFARLLRTSVLRSRELDAERTRLQTEQAIAAALQADYRERFSDLARTVIPVLRLLADRPIASDDPEVQELARAESARLRRLFAQSDAFDHPLVQHLRRGLDEAERRGVTVGFDLDSRPPDLPVEESTQTVSALNDLIDGARSRVRLVVTSSPSIVTVSVVSDCESDLVDNVRARLDGSRYELTTDGSVVWVRVHFPVPVSV
ncbi:ATP-binding protein [Smaragdicoccus niigatensis]|uniref:ATP-binding protein n=1 Tax=Smaragdicoccus niigatensis TaxID=359359 RepID=UPI000382406D|nr:ATP-binding protein [Smaragdicoccus niigatensis]